MPPIRIELIFYRIGHFLHGWRVPVLPTIFTGLTRLVFGAYIPHSCSIGKKVIFAYWAVGVVVHNRAIIEDEVLIAQNVTLGGRSGQQGAPRICKGAYIGAGAKVLGPVRVGEGAVIGANAVVIKDIPDHGIAAGVPARVIRIQQDRPEVALARE